MTVGCWWRVRLLGDVRLHLAAFYGYFAFAFASYLLLLWLIGRWEKNGDGSIFQPRKNRTVPIFAIGLVLVVAVMARLLLLGTTPTLSDDIYRYRWDGCVQLAGIDPYAYPPNHPALQALRDEDFARINFPHLRTVYPPLTQVAFRSGAALNPTLTAQKSLFVGAELLTVACLLALLAHQGRSLLWVAAYAWHPLVILEIAGSGHNDTLGIAWLWVGLVAWQWRRYGMAAVGWALAFLSKYATLILLPWWWRQRSVRRWALVCSALAAVPIACCPTVVSALLESLSAMAGRFESNSSLYLLLVWGLGQAVLARVVAIGAWMGLVAWWALREPDPGRYLFKVMAAAALLSPVLHPWYLVWLVPFFCFWRVPALMAWTLTAVLAYTVWPGYLAGGAWRIPVWAHVLEYLPVALWGLWGMGRCVWRSSHHLPESLQATAALRRAPLAHRQAVGIIIPARNEAAALGQVLAELPRGLLHEILVVDNGSTDETAELARRSGARVVSEPIPGYGRACLAGLAAMEPSVEVVAFMDGDHADDPEDLARLLAPIQAGQADLVIGSRVAQAAPGSLTPQQRFGNRLACALMRWGFGVRYTDLGPFRAIRREALERLGMTDQAFGWTVEMQAKAARRGLRIVEIPVRYRPRIGRSKISGTVRGTIRAGVAIISTIVRVAWQSQREAPQDLQDLGGLTITKHQIPITK